MKVPRVMSCLGVSLCFSCLFTGGGGTGKLLLTLLKGLFTLLGTRLLLLLLKGLGKLLTFLLVVVVLDTPLKARTKELKAMLRE